MNPLRRFDRESAVPVPNSLIRSSFLLVPLFFGPSAGAQEREDGVRDELTKLFQKVEKDLKEIDRLLLEAGGTKEAAEKSAEAAAGMKKILEEARGRERSVVDAIDEILKKAPT